MKLRTKILIPIIIIVSCAIIGMGIYGYKSAEKIALVMVDSNLKSTLDTVVDTIDERKEIMNITREAMNKKNIYLAASVAEMIANNPEMLAAEKLVDLSKKIGVNEIHIVNEKGILIHSNIPDFIGFDFNSTEQTRPFLKALTDNDFALAQDPTERGVDKKLFQYIGVARKDKPGLIQIGLEPKGIQELIKKMDIQKLVERIHLGGKGYATVLDKNGIIIANPNKDYIGKDISKEEWGNELIEKEEGELKYTYEGLEKYSRFIHFKDNIVMTVFPAEEFKIYINKIKKAILYILVIAILSVLITVLMFLKSQLSKPLMKLVEAMQQAGDGNLEISLDVKSKDEIGELSKGFNKMTNQIKMLISNIKDTSIMTEKTSSAITTSSEEIGTSSTEIARTIQEIAAGSSNQAHEASMCLEITNNLAEKIEIITNRLKNASINAKKMEEMNGLGLGAMKELKRKFEDNTQASIDVSKGIEELAEKSSAIEAIIETIRSIAEQTNLLALNAAIEAARAGEEGRGFAVVAEEVRRLAEQSTVSTEEIQGIIQEIVGVINNTNRTMDSAKVVVEKVNNYLEETEKIYNEIKSVTKEVTEQIESLNYDVGSIDEAKDNVLKSIGSISTISEETAAATEEISASSEEQTAAIEEVVASIQELDRMIEELSESIKIFRV